MDPWKCALGFMDSQILLTAEELGVFNALDDGAGTADEVAEATGLPPDSADRLLIALCALDIVKKDADARYVNGEEAAAKLVEGEPGYIGDMFRHVREDLYPLWRHFREALVDGAAQWDRAFANDGGTPRNEAIHEDPDTLRSFHEGMQAVSYPAAAEFAASAPELEEIEHIVDIGGAGGAFLIALAEAQPDLRGTVLDLAQVEPIAEEFFRRHGVDDRLTFRTADFFHDPIPAGADAYSLGFVLHDWDTDAGSLLLRKVADAARPGSLLIIGEYFLNDEKTGPLFVARSNLNMLIAARGRERSASEYADWIREFGFERERIRLTSHGKNFLIARRR